MSCLQIGAVILAAGTATRMGRLKQLLAFQGGTLLGHAIDQADKAGFAPVIVVVGAQADAVQSAIASKDVEIVRNDQWSVGMGSSIAAGMARLQDIDGTVGGVALLVGDQPLVTAEHLASMRVHLHQRGAHIVAAEYGGSLGVPVIFGRQMFGRLLALRPEAGAKSLLHSPDVKVCAFPLAEAETDIDTPEDWERIARKL